MLPVHACAAYACSQARPDGGQRRGKRATADERPDDAWRRL